MRIQNQAVIDARWRVERPLTTTGQHYLLTDQDSFEQAVLSLLPAGIDSAAAEQWCTALSSQPHPGLMLPTTILSVDDQLALLTPSVIGQPLDQVSSESLPDLLRLIARSAELLHALHLQGRSHGSLQSGLIWLKNATTPRVCGVLPMPESAEPIESTRQADLRALASILLDQLIDPTAALSETCRQACRDYPEAIAVCKIYSAPRPQMAAPKALAHLLHQILDGAPGVTTSDTAGISVVEFRDQLDDLALSVSRSAPRSRPDWTLESLAASTMAGSTTPAHSASPDQSSDRQPHRRFLPALLVFSVLILLVFGTWLLSSSPSDLPALTPTVVDAEPDEIDSVVSVPETPEIPDEAALQVLFEARESAQEILDALIADRQILDERAVADWADEPFNRVLAWKSEGDQQFVQQQFVEAQGRYAEALTISQSLIERWPNERDAANQHGMAALADGDSATALASFTLAAAIDADDPLAQKGLARSAVLDQVLLLSRQARQALRDDDLPASQALYQQVRDLDSDTPGVDQNLVSIQTQLADQAYRAEVSTALSALEQGRFEAARASFDQANRLRPGTTVVRDGLQDIKRRLRDQRVVDHRQRAEQLIAQEQWQDAARHFEEVLKRDPDAAFAQQGNTQAVERQALDESLSGMLNEPSRWWSPQGRDLMQASLDQATLIGQPGPRLQDQISRLQAELSRSNQAVEVALQSDNLCQVDVYRVSRLGQFSKTSLRLKPGSYTVVGTRPGYRDVRKIVRVQAGQSPDPVRVICDEEV